MLNGDSVLSIEVAHNLLSDAKSKVEQKGKPLKRNMMWAT